MTPVYAKNTVAKFGAKVKELYEVIEQTPEWRTYVSSRNAEMIETLLETNNMTAAHEKLGVPYTTFRANLLNGLERIKEKRTDFQREGRSEQAQELFHLMDTVTNWEEHVTEHEQKLALAYRELRNFYDVGERLNVKPSNVSAALYGNTQKIGVIGKLKRVLMHKDSAM